MYVVESDFCRVSLVRSSVNVAPCSLNGPKDAAAFAKCLITEGVSIYETMIVLLVNVANKVVGYAVIGVGGISGVLVDVRLVLKYALDFMAVGVILVHNHPSGNINPSSQDIVLTKKIKRALKLCEINLLDHIIISGVDDKYYSIGKEGAI